MKEHDILFERMKALIEKLLGDEHGISETAFAALYDAIQAIPLEKQWQKNDLLDLLRWADATDGRFYYATSGEE